MIFSSNLGEKSEPALFSNYLDEKYLRYFQQKFRQNIFLRALHQDVCRNLFKRQIYICFCEKIKLKILNKWFLKEEQNWELDFKRAIMPAQCPKSKKQVKNGRSIQNEGWLKSKPNCRSESRHNTRVINFSVTKPLAIQTRLANQEGQNFSRKYSGMTRFLTIKGDE